MNQVIKGNMTLCDLVIYEKVYTLQTDDRPTTTFHNTLFCYILYITSLDTLVLHTITSISLRYFLRFSGPSIPVTIPHSFLTIPFNSALLSP